jgi:hypothetical protein
MGARQADPILGIERILIHERLPDAPQTAVILNRGIGLRQNLIRDIYSSKFFQ